MIARMGSGGVTVEQGDQLGVVVLDPPEHLGLGRVGQVGERRAGKGTGDRRRVDRRGDEVQQQRDRE
jgi:hypothetical protein